MVAMDTRLDFTSMDWFAWLEPTAQQLVINSRDLVLREERMHSALTDYSFCVFPMAKAYEGFLKQFFLDLHVIDSSMHLDKHFRIGRSFNPDLPSRYKDQYWFYDDVVNQCSDASARKLWDTWIVCRNHVFHYFPGKSSELTLAQAKKLVIQVGEAMSIALVCIRESSSQEKR